MLWQLQTVGLFKVLSERETSKWLNIMDKQLADLVSAASGSSIDITARDKMTTTFLLMGASTTGSAVLFMEADKTVGAPSRLGQLRRMILKRKSGCNKFACFRWPICSGSEHQGRGPHAWR